LTSTREKNYNLYYILENEFNNYAKKENLDITVKITLLTHYNATIYTTRSYGSMVESLLKKHSSKYDIFFYDNTYTSKYSPYLMDLTEYISEEELKEFNPYIISKLCTYQNKLFGLVKLNFFFLIIFINIYFFFFYLFFYFFLLLFIIIT